jgi:hypothetical protein
MKLQICLRVGIPVQGLAFILVGLAFASMPARACTIFVLTDTNRALFCNNEDWSNTNSRVWFQPAGNGYYGAVYVGFDNGWAMGGLNTEGLAYDWVGGYTEKWELNPQAQPVRGSSSQRMIETCATVKDAIAFYRSHEEPGFSRSKILVADRTGASVIIGERDGKLQVYPDNQCRGFGFGRSTLEAALARDPEPTVGNGFKILRDCRQSGDYATRYSNIYDLKTGDVFLHPISGRDDGVKFNLTVELKKGGHYYDMPKIQEQLTQAPQPLLLNMERFPVDKFKPIPDQEPKVTAHLRAMTQDARNGTMQADDFTTEAWKKALPMQKEIQANTKLLGDLVSLTLVDRGEVDGQRSYRYRAEFAKATLLVHYVFDGQNKLVSGATEAYEWKPGANVVKTPEAASPPVTGIGVMLRVDGKNIIVQELVPDTPAASQKDIHAGDRILAVAQEDGPAVPVESAKLDQAVDLIHGPAGTIVYLTLVSAGEDDSHARVVRFVRAALKAPPY